MNIQRFDYIAADSVKHALAVLAEKGAGARVMAGGTDLMVKMNHGLLQASVLIDIKRIKELEKISFDRQKGLTIGATALLAEVASHPDILAHYPAIADAAEETANVQIRNMGTVAGNLCNAAPSAENAPTLMAMGAEVILESISGERRVSLDQFFTGPGQTCMEPGEIMTRIVVPAPLPQSGTSYKHISARGKVDISAVCVGVMMSVQGKTCKEARIVLGAVAPTPMRATQAEAVINGKKMTDEIIEKAGSQASNEARPISDVRASAEYRKKMVAVLTRRALKEAHERAMKSYTGESAS